MDAAHAARNACPRCCLRLQVPPTVYMWPMVAFATAILLNLLTVAFERRPVKRQLCFLAVYISGAPFSPLFVRALPEQQ